MRRYVHIFTHSPCRSKACNGRSEYCARKFSEVTFLGAHDSFATSTNPFALSRNQRISLSDQLSMGIRLFQGQGHARDGTVHLCHTSCMLFDGGSVQDYLTTVKAFLDVNPNEVVTILFTNPERAICGRLLAPCLRLGSLNSPSHPRVYPLQRRTGRFSRT